jgi:hypothetical protein
MPPVFDVLNQWRQALETLLGISGYKVESVKYLTANFILNDTKPDVEFDGLVSCFFQVQTSKYTIQRYDLTASSPHMTETSLPASISSMPVNEN